MARSQLSVDEFDSLVRPLVGMSVSLPWKGYGSAIFLELGRLAPLGEGRQHHNKGEACISFEWDWRVEEKATVLYGSSNSRPKIDKGISGLRGTNVERISVVGPVPELVIHFSNGQCLKSMVMVSGDPQWTIRLPGAVWVSCEAGVLFAGDGSALGLTKEETAMYAQAEAIALRWGTPVAEPKLGDCRDCKSYVRLDGDGHLLDFGVCTESGSPFDGRVVNCQSGCPAFSSTELT